MLVALIIVSVLCVILLFLYIHLRRDIKSLNNQLEYTLKEQSEFTLFFQTSNKDMQEIIRRVNSIKNDIQFAKNKFIKDEGEIRNMITNISHDIRTPLTSIQGYVEMMQNNEDSNERQRYYQIIMQRLSDLESMLDEFFLYTKLMSSENDEPLLVQEIYPIICNQLLKYMDVLATYHFAPKVICDNENIQCAIHEESLKRICANLIVNTLRYGRDPFQVIIKQENNQIFLIFENAILPSTNLDVNNLFERFYKVGEARTQKGSGLGLAIVKELVHRMNGTITAQVQDDKLQVTIIFEG